MMTSGNSPEPTYPTPYPPHYLCHINLGTYFPGNKGYVPDFLPSGKNVVELLPSDFRDGFTSYVMKGEKDPGLNGHRFSLSFRFGPTKETETVKLSLQTVIGSTQQAFAEFKARRGEGVIEGRLSQSSSAPDQSVQFTVSCEEVKK